MNENDSLNELNNEKYINSQLISIINDIETKYNEIGSLIDEFHLLLGDDADATVDNGEQVKNLLNKYSQLKK